MKRCAVAMTVLCAAAMLASAEPAARDGIVDVKRELYAPHPEGGGSVLLSTGYVGPGLERDEIRSVERVSDEPENPKRRLSPDNGRTWSEFEPMPAIVTRHEGFTVYWGAGPAFYDSAAGATVSIWLRQTYWGNVYYNQCYSRISTDNGKTWAEPRQLRYEEGPPLDPANPRNPEYLSHNQAYFGNDIIRHSNGTLIHCVVSANVPYVNTTGKSYHPWFPADAKNIGALCFIGKWNAQTKDYDWTPGKPVWAPLDVSSRGLMEAEVAELTDGRVLVIWRGSDTPVTEGRKWFSVSGDGGLTLSPVQELTYDDGSRFYSPSSIHRMVRHSITQKLYWVGNVCPNPPSANSPRYPLIIAEVDESIPALKRNTVTVIDDRAPTDSPDLQLSNFSVFEDKEAHAIELYLTRYGTDPANTYNADAYKYTLTIKEAGSASPKAVTVRVVQGGESQAKPEDCRGVIVGPGVNQPDPFPGYAGFVGWESSIRLKDGAWLVGFSAGYWHASPPTPPRYPPETLAEYHKMGMPSDVEAPRGGRAMITRSTDDGKTWSKPETLIDTPADDRHPSFLQLADGTILCSFFTYVGSGDLQKDPTLAHRTRVTRSFDNGHTWEQEPKALPSPFLADESDGPMVLLNDGSVLLVINGMPAGGGPDQVALLRSKDRGDTWEVLSTIATDHAMYEPSVAALPDGRLVIIARPEGDIFWSSDGGRTWTKPVTFGMRLFAPSLRVLHDGTLLCLHGSYGAGGLRAIFSTDGGETWIAPAPNYGFLVDNSYGYGKAMELPDGSLFIVYISSGGHGAEDARANAEWCIRMKIRPDHSGIDLLPAPNRK